MDITPSLTINSHKSSQTLKLFIGKRPAEISLDKLKARHYLANIDPKANINTITRRKLIWEGVANNYYFAVFQSSTAMMAIYIDSSGLPRLIYPAEFWTANEYIDHHPQSCIKAFLAEFVEAVECNPAPFNSERQLAYSFLSWLEANAPMTKALYYISRSKEVAA